jgi:hypothetical protein
MDPSGEKLISGDDVMAEHPEQAKQHARRPRRSTFLIDGFWVPKQYFEGRGCGWGPFSIVRLQIRVE